MTFECQCCGECCSTMGEIISVREQTGHDEYRIAYTDGEERVVTIDPDKRDLFRSLMQGEKRSLACPFLRQQAHDRYVCTVHSSRPELCRGYFCSRILVLDNQGKKAGRVLCGTRTFMPENESVRILWNDSMRDILVPDDEDWEKTVERIFSGAGYRVIR